MAGRGSRRSEEQSLRVGPVGDEVAQAVTRPAPGWGQIRPERWAGPARAYQVG